MVEWFKAAVLKTAGAQAPEGSNPSLSAIFLSKKMANEAARLLFTAQSTTSLKRRSLFLYCKRWFEQLFANYLHAIRFKYV